MANRIYEMFTAGLDRGQQRKERRTLSDYLQPALGGDQPALAQIYGANPDTGMKVEGLAQQRAQSGAEAARKRAADLSNVMLRAPQMAAQVYPQFKQAYEGLGLGITLPDQYEEGALDLARALAPSTEGEQYTLAPGAARYGPDGRLIAERPFAPIKPEYQLYDGADGPSWIPKPMAGPQGAPQATPPSGAPLDPVRDFGQLGTIPGVNTTSLYRDPERNARVGGVENSFHMKGQAGDFVVPQDQKAQFIQRARDMGYDAIDEGDHVHVEPRRGARAASAFGPGQGISAIPVQGVRPKPKAASDGAPSGYRYAPDGQSLIPIPGGPADPNTPKALPPAQAAKREEARRKEARMLTSATAELDETIALIDDILKREGDFGGVTGAGALGARIPGTDWADLDNKLETLRARSAFGSLQEMRANSPTGGALGSVTERELGLLQNAEAQLGTRQSPRALKESLQAYRRVIDGSKRRLREGYGEFYQDAPSAQTNGPVRIQSAAEYNALPSGATYIAPDGTQRRKK